MKNTKLHILLALIVLFASTGTAYPQEIGTNDYRITTFGTNGDPAMQAINPSIAYCSGTNKYLVVWSGIVSGEYEIYGQLLDGNTGAPEGSAITISNMGPSGSSTYSAVDPDVAASASEFFVVWSGDDNTAPLVDNEFEIYGQRINASTGALVASRIRISDMGTDGDANFDANTPSIVFNSTGNSGSPEYLVAWSGDDNTGSLINDEFEIYVQRLSVTGDASAFANDVKISDLGPDGFLELKGFLPDVAWNSANNQYLVVWYGDDVVTPLVDDELEIFMQRLTSTGAETGLNDIRVSSMGPNGNTAYAAFDPSVAYNAIDNNYLIVWQADNTGGSLVDNEIEIYGQIVSNLGATGTTFRISDMGTDGSINFGGFDAFVQHDPNLDQFLVVWNGDDNTGGLVDNENEIFGQIISGAGTEVGTDIRLSDAGGTGSTTASATRSSLVFNNSMREFVIVWDADDTDLGLADSEFEIIGQRFAVLSTEPSAQPTVPVFSAITSSSFTVTYTAASGTPEGYLVLRKSGSSPTDAPADHTAYTVGSPIGGSTVAYVGSALTFNESGLNPNTAYHYDFFSYNGVNSSTNYRTTTPLEGSAITLASEPTGQTQSFSFSAIGTSSVTVNYTNGNGSSRLVVCKAGSAVNAFPQDASQYTANNAFGSGSDLGSGNFVVAVGNGPATVTGLSAATTYHFRAFEFNGTGAQTNYNTGTATDNPKSASTLATQPANQPTGLTFNSITSTSMNGSFTSASGSPDGYIVLRKAGSSPSDVPADGQTYSAGATIGTSTVVSSGSGTTFASSSLNSATVYHYDVFSYNGSGAATNYLTPSPLESSQVTRATEPSAQPTALAFTSVTPTSMNGSFTAASGTPDGYLVLRNAGSSPTDTPVDGTSYTAGNTLGSSFIVAVGSAVSFSSASLSAESSYFYDVFAYNGSGATLNYFLTSPLEGSRKTLADEPSSPVSGVVFSDHTTASYSIDFTAAGGPVDGYLIVRKQGSAPSGTPVDGTSYTAGTSTISGDPVVYIGSANTFDETALASGTSYQYAIYPFNGSAEATNYLVSGTSNKGSTVTLPETPVIQTATEVGQTSFRANWSAVTGAANYELDVSADDFVTKITGYDAKSVTGNTDEIAGLTAGVTYKYRVRAINSIGGTSPFSNPAGIQLTVPPTPVDLATSGAEQTQMSVTWTASLSATEYLLYVSDNATFTPAVAGYGPKTVTLTNETINGLTPGNTYYVKLQSRNDGGGPASPETSTISQLLKPATPLAVDAVNANSSSFKAKWETAHGAAGYEIDVSLQSNFSSHVASYPRDVGNTLEESVAGLESSTTYFYTVRARNSTGASPYGNTVSITTDAPPGGSELAVTDPLTFVPVFPLQQSSASVVAQVTGGGPGKTVTLFHRPITSTGDYSGLPMTNTSGNAWNASLLPAFMDEMGAEFYVRAEDGTSFDETQLHYMYKGINVASNQSIPFASTFTGETRTYQMFSLPYELLAKDVDKLFDVALDGHDNTRWRLFHYQGGMYREYPNQFVELKLGEGYWFNSKVNDFSIVLAEGVVTPVNQNTPYTKSLEAGWNQIGNPFPFNISWSAVVGDNDKIGSLFFFNNGVYKDSDVLKPWTGAFVHADEAMTLSIPVMAKTTASGRRKQDEMTPDLDGEKWLVPVTVRINEVEQESGVGMHPLAKNSKDKFDEITLPRFVDYAEMSTYHEEFFSPNFSTDVVTSSVEKTWVFEVKSNSEEGGEGELRWDNTAFASSQSSLILIDLHDDKWVDMKSTNRYTFKHAEGRQMKIMYNRSGEVNPGITMLGDAYPNPFADEVHIPLLVGERGYKQIEFYDGFGRLVARVGTTFEKPGLHEITWYIKDNGSLQASSGLLFYRLAGQSPGKIKRIIKN